MDSSKVYLVQTDTTVGFLSSNDKKLSTIKQRDQNQKILQTVDSNKTLKQYTRVPKKFRKLVRRSKNTTFIYPNNLGLRVVDNLSYHHSFISKFNCLYSTSANKHKEDYDEEFAISNVDIVVYSKNSFNISSESSIVKINKRMILKLR